MARAGIIALLLLCVGGIASAQSVEEAIAPIEELVVNGEQPGPALWKVQHGDHVLWVLGTVSPLPKNFAWRSREAEQRLAESDLLIPGVGLRGTGVGLFTGLRLLPAALRARKLPKGETLASVLEPSLYVRWSALKAVYLPKDDDVDELRPLLAALTLYGKVMDRAGLGGGGQVNRLLRKENLRPGGTVRTPEVQLEIKDPRGLIQEYAESPPGAEFGCFDRVLTRIESELPQMQQRAEAWAKGDIATLRRLNDQDVEDRCLDVFTATPRIAERLNEGRRRMEQEALLVMEGAVLQHASSFTVMPIRELLSPDGLLAKLRARGYEVVEPRE
jgi:uncharacterized protein YbaP (TraB family)